MNKILELRQNLKNLNFFSLLESRASNIEEVKERFKLRHNIKEIWAVSFIFMPMVGFVTSALTNVCVLISSFVSFLIYSKLIARQEEKSNSNKIEEIIDLVSSEEFHQYYFPYLNSLYQSYPQSYNKEKIEKLKLNLVSQINKENILDIIKEVEKIENVLLNIEKQKQQYIYEKSLGVETFLYEEKEMNFKTAL